jgi:triosephosphate isomerase (TIM)
MARRKIAAGNWKMHGLRADLAQLDLLAQMTAQDARCDIIICPPATLISACAHLPFGIGGQDCHTAKRGAHTGDISAMMLADAGAAYVITGHSERRSDHRETDAQIAAKTAAAHDAGLTAILCIGETLLQRDAGQTLDILGAQLAQSLPASATAQNTIIAYEPVWAIGTGLIPDLDDIAAAHKFIRAQLPFGADCALLYGGSVKPANADGIFALADVDGALVGGASLLATDFAAIIAALSRACPSSE